MAKKRPRKATPPPPPPAVRQALEAALAANPDDIGAHMAYADWLTEQGDPRGEFIQVQLALEDPRRSVRERDRRRQREQALRQAHEREWLGKLATYLLDLRDVGRSAGPGRTLYRHLLARGWLDTLHVERLTVPFARNLAQAPEARLLRRLTVFETSDRGLDETTEAEEEAAGPYLPGLGPPPEEERYSLSPLRQSPYLTNVRFFHLGLPVDELLPDRFPSRVTTAGGVADAVARMPRLEELHLLAFGFDAGKLFGLPTLGNLRVLRVYHLRHYPLARLAENPAVGNFTHLLLHPDRPRGPGYPPVIGRDDVRALLASPHLRSLKYLELHLAEVGDTGCADIVASGILKRLEVLDLRYGTISDAGARTLAACPDLRRLDRLLLAHNLVGPAGADLLRATGVRVDLGYQHDYRGDPDLYEGDME
jgi:uncharacterized protein (TIGR02996 family)